MKKFFSFLLVVFIWQSLSLSSFADIPIHAPYAGGVAILSLESTTQKPKVYLGQEPVLVVNTSVINEPTEWKAIVGIPLDTESASINVRVEYENNQSLETIKIQPHHYRSERLTIKNKRKVTPLQEDLNRISEDKSLLQTAYQTLSNYHLDDLTLKLPVRGRVSSSFGRKRILNGIPKNPHTGMDIAAIEGTPIYAPLPGKVILTRDLFYSGQFILLDHGQGFMTGYAHLSQINVKQNDWIKIGDLIGKVGQTGRVTGSHLHWVVRLNGTPVDPKLFLPNITG